MAVAIRILGMTLIELLKHLDVAVRIEIIRLTSKIPTAEGKTPPADCSGPIKNKFFDILPISASRH
ncbi:MAG: hypothetical protein TU36_008230 [Vulcanisaeta sp. AZ3]